MFDPLRIRRLLESSGAELSDPLVGEELAAIEDRYSVRFGADHKELLAVAAPLGKGWPNWRGDDHDELRRRIAGPIDGVLFDVEHNGFWAHSWGDSPAGTADRVSHAREHLATIPRLLPVYVHRFLPAEVHEPGFPVLSVHQTDVIYYGRDLVDYLEREWGPKRSDPVDSVDPQHRLPFWSALAENRVADA